MLTYLNKDDNPIIRQCANCINFNPIPGADRLGYCKVKPLFFAYTGQESVYVMTRPFYRCDDHEFNNEEFLKKNAKPVEITLKPKKT